MLVTPKLSQSSRLFGKKFLGGANEREADDVLVLEKRKRSDVREEKHEREKNEKFRRAKVKPGFDTTSSPLRSARPCNINIRETADAAHIGT